MAMPGDNISDAVRIDISATKPDLVHQLIRVAVAENDATLLRFILRNSWNLERIFHRTDVEGNTFLHQATWRNHAEVARVLIENSIDLNCKEIGGATCLHIAAARGYSRILALLIEANADPLVQDADGRRPLDLALEEQDRELLRTYTLKCSETRFILNMTVWRDKPPQFERANDFNSGKAIINMQEASSRSSMDFKNPRTDVTQKELSRADSGIASDAESDLSRTSISSSSTAGSEMKPPKLSSKSFSVRDISAVFPEKKLISNHLARRVTDRQRFVRDLSSGDGVTVPPLNYQKVRRAKSFNFLADVKKSEQTEQKGTKRFLYRGIAIPTLIESYL